jgi:hypothetical protein
VRANALLVRFDAGQANVFFPGAGQGLEIALLLRRMGRHRALFAWEPEPFSFQLILRLHDLAADLGGERLVLTACDAGDLSGKLLAWLDRHPGHLCPDRMMMWPWQTPAEIAPLRAALEAVYRQIEERRAAALNDTRRRLAEPVIATASPGSLAIALYALHANDETWTLTDRLRACGEMPGWSILPVDVRCPGDMHSLARTHRLLDAPRRPDWAILLNVTRSQVRDALPENLPAVAWLSSETAVDALKGPPEPGDAVAVTSQRLAERVNALGVSPERVAVVPLPCLCRDLGVDPSTGTTEVGGDRPTDVVILADVLQDDPARGGPTLATHAAIWRTTIDLLKARIDGFHAEQMDSLLRRAEDKVGSRIDDPSARRDILQQLGMQVAPSLLMQFLAGTLIRAGVRLRLHGTGWGREWGDAVGGPVPTIAAREAAIRQSKVLVHADLAGEVRPGALLAAGSGTVVVGRRHPADALAGGLATLLEPGRQAAVFSTAREMVQTIQTLISDEHWRREIAVAARRRCLQDHHPRAALERLRAAASSVSGVENP